MNGFALGLGLNSEMAYFSSEGNFCIENIKMHRQASIGKLYQVLV